MSLYAQPYGGQKTLIKSGTVDSHGNLAATWRLTRNTTFTAAFTGDDDYGPATAALAVKDHCPATSACQFSNVFRVRGRGVRPEGFRDASRGRTHRLPPGQGTA